MVKADAISFSITNRLLLAETSLYFEAGKSHVIMGANGAGKSTLLKILSGNQKPTSGNVFFDDRKLSDFSRKDLAKRRAVLSQHYHIAFPISVEDFVLMGRYPYYQNNPLPNDRAICHKAMQRMEVDVFKDRDYNTLSGGEAQKVQMSRVLAQVWPNGKNGQNVLFLDEPVSNLDMRYQQQLLQVAKEFCQKSVTIIAVLHDINLALSFADRIIFMKNGVVLYTIDDYYSLSPDMIQDVFGIKVKILNLNEKDRPIVVF